MNKQSIKEEDKKLEEKTNKGEKETEFDRKCLNTLRFYPGRVSIDRRDTWERTFDSDGHN